MPSTEVIKALDLLHKELSKLEPAIKHVEMATEVTKMIHSIPQKHDELLNLIQKRDEELKLELQKQFGENLKELAEEHKKLVRIAERILAEVGTETAALANLRDVIQKFYERIEKIDFPARLDKLDANVASVVSAIQASQNRIESLDRNISARIDSISNELKVGIKGIETTLAQSAIELNAKIDKNDKKYVVYNFITWGLIIISVVVLFLR